MPKSLPIYLVDDEATVLESMAFMLESYGYRVHTFESGQAFLDSVDLNSLGCVILDSRMPNMTGQDVQREMQAKGSTLSVIYLTGHGDIPMAVEALKSGAFDFFQKPVEAETLMPAIELAMQKSMSHAQKGKEHQAMQSLTKREKEVLKLLVQGMKNQQMAETLFVSVRTIEVHRSNIMKKLNVNNVAALIHRVGTLLED
ncbi:Response regulator protein TmoT [Vibrio stylophorae]|uniref:Response regulator protein TmoT n=1 Tax=Vibrio stylophorae TaxID=659351 RepID=A0ABM8ZY28_9VIBR|nr:response regulator [Vibrio stylophorae]CAH0535171.1 Response regulator protein TmoT [Vibrio stylophorae]